MEENGVLYKYKVLKNPQSNQEPLRPCKTSQKGKQTMVYLQDEEAYELIMEDYNDKIWNDNLLNKSNNVSSPHTLLNPAYFDDKKVLKRVRTPIEPIEELKKSSHEQLRTSGSYSIESLRNTQNGGLFYTKGETLASKHHNTNHLKFKGGRYPQNLSKLSAHANVCTMDIGPNFHQDKERNTLEKTHTVCNTKTLAQTKYDMGFSSKGFDDGIKKF